MEQHYICNIAIIAHVDHGKTTMIDSMFKQSGIFRDNQVVAERLMDSNALEKERGITILAKCTSINWNGNKLNIIDTPGHADFGGEVERVLSMADGVLLLVDSAEGVMPQTKFVLSKALQANLQPIVIINKIDKPDARPQEVVDEVLELLIVLDASDSQLNCPILYASGRNGWCVSNLEDPRENLQPLFQAIVSHIQPPKYDYDAPFKMLVTLLDSDQFLGRMLIGKIYQGQAKLNTPIIAVDLNGKQIEQNRLTKLYKFEGIKKASTENALAGDIVAIAGLDKASVADTIATPADTTPIKAHPIDPPTISITIGANDSPFAGQSGDKLTSRAILSRLMREVETNVTIKVEEMQDKEAFKVSGRGELQLGVLLETMRREGFEFCVSRPKVLFQTDPNDSKQLLEPIEEVIIDVDDEFSGMVIDKMNTRKGIMQDMRKTGQEKTRLVFLAPSRCLIGYHGEFLTDTRGTGVMNKIFHGYEPHKGPMNHKRKGVLIATEQGEATAYALSNTQERGKLFIKPQDAVYCGMVVGINSRDNDMDVNVTKGKQLTNVRAAGADEMIKLTPPILISLEEMIAFIEDDELVEVTPKYLRMRKKYLDPNERKRASRSQQQG